MLTTLRATINQIFVRDEEVSGNHNTLTADGNLLFVVCFWILQPDSVVLLLATGVYLGLRESRADCVERDVTVNMIPVREPVDLIFLTSE